MSDLDLDADPAPRGHLGSRRGNTGGAEVLQRDQQVLIQQLQATFDQHLLAERVADLDVGPLRLGFFGELVRGEGSPVYTVAPGLRAQQDDEVACTSSARTDEILYPDKSYAHSVDQWVTGVGPPELDLPSYRRHPDGVPVSPDATHYLPKVVAVALLIQRPEPQRIEQRHWPRAHRQDVADDPTHPRRRPLVRLHRRRMVVTLHLESQRPPVPHLDHPGILPRPLQDPLPLVREAAEEWARILVAAVLAPHHGEQRELQEIRRPSHQLQYAVVLEVREPQRTVCLLDIQTPAPTSTERRILKPSSEPRAGSQTLSGCGMMPTTLRPSLQTPAMSFTDPFGFSR